MPIWKDVPDEIKKRFPSPPDRNDFSNQEEFEEARGYWQHSIGRSIGLAMQVYSSKK